MPLRGCSRRKALAPGDLIAYLARGLVDNREAVRVDEVEREGALVLELRVAPEEVGKVIGRQGRIVRALRTIVRACAARSNRRMLLEIVDE